MIHDNICGKKKVTDLQSKRHTTISLSLEKFRNNETIFSTNFNYNTNIHQYG